MRSASAAAVGMRASRSWAIAALTRSSTRRGQAGGERGERRRIVDGDLDHQRVVVLFQEGEAPGERLVEDDAQRVDVGSRVELEAAAGLLRAHVRGRADHRAGARDAWRERSGLVTFETPKSSTLATICPLGSRWRKTLPGLSRGG